MVNEFFLKMFL